MSSTRQRIVDRLEAKGPAATATLAEHMGMTSEAIRFHLRVLESDCMVAKHKIGNAFVWTSTCDEPVPERKPSGRPLGDKRAMLTIQNALDEEGQMTAGDIAAITGLPEKRVRSLLATLESDGRVWSSGRYWSLRGNRKAKPKRENMADWVEYQRKTAIGRFLTGAPV
ncbi:MAG: helix-turn-helix domain-containing protein [Alcanivorax sediminis]|uniref:helix-turn-helix domain-containing protein n=1 Tax=Alcanivorax sediminis TaxID=2663008 RepID=UPI003C408641